VGARGDGADIAEAVDALSGLGEDAVSLRAAGLAGISAGLARHGRRLRDLAAPDAAAEATAGRIRSLLEGAVRLSSDGRVDEAARRDAVSLLADAPWEVARPALEAILREAGEDLRVEATRSLGRARRPEAFAMLLEGWGRQSAAIRREAAGALVRDHGGALSLLAAVEDGRIGVAELGAARISQLLEDQRSDVREAAKRLFGGIPEDRRLVMERYRPALAAKADRARGRTVFEKHCASCHRVSGLGIAVGPDISDVEAKDPEALLADILDPSRAIDGNHVQYAIQLKDGAVIAGLVAAETRESLTLKRAEGETIVIPRGEIQEVRASNASLMPDGLEKSVSVEEMADLIAFLRDGRYLEGAPPLLRPSRPGAAKAPLGSNGSPRAE
jgi:putative heme-binding domain-containing protein